MAHDFARSEQWHEVIGIAFVLGVTFTDWILIESNKTLVLEVIPNQCLINRVLALDFYVRGNINNSNFFPSPLVEEVTLVNRHSDTPRNNLMATITWLQ